MADSPQVSLDAPKTLTVAADAVSIYEGGKFYTVAIADLLGNEVALRQLINDYNHQRQANVGLEAEVQRLKREQAAFGMQPLVLGLNAVLGIAGVVLVGLGTNYLSGPEPPRGAWLTLSAGVLLSIVAALTPIVLPWFTARVVARK